MEGVNGGVIFCSHVVEVEEEEARRGGGRRGRRLTGWSGSMERLSDWSTAAAAAEEMQMASGFSPRFI